MAVPDYQTLMLPVLTVAAAGEIRVGDAADRIADELGLSLEDREALLPSGRQKLLRNRIHWAKTYLAKAGLVDMPRRGWFVATEEGRRLLATRPARIDNGTLMSYPAFRGFFKRTDAPAAPAPEAGAATPEEQVDTAHAALQDALRDELLGRILENSPGFFERLIVDLLVAMGYGGSHSNAALQLGRSGDGGIDGLINEDRLGLDRIFVQAKRYSPGNVVGRPDVQAFVGSLVGHGATKGVFVTTSTFSQQARDFLNRIQQRVVLIDGRRLAGLMIEHGVGVRVTRTVTFQRLDEDFFTEED
ncbi:restriction endonuclease (plasmid) [Tistrella mobilis]|uniref:restriction endonuclease n=1 Tax=Tistrella mobilis TaxID=171437 RepID=UPI003555FA5A